MYLGGIGCGPNFLVEGVECMSGCPGGRRVDRGAWYRRLFASVHYRCWAWFGDLMCSRMVRGLRWCVVLRVCLEIDVGAVCWVGMYVFRLVMALDG